MSYAKEAIHRNRRKARSLPKMREAIEPAMAGMFFGQ